MKSLESLEIINVCLKELDYEHKEDTNIWRYDLEVIKQDLEVLEIFNKFFGDVEITTYDWDGKKRGEMRFSGTDYYTYAKDENEALQLVKLKQWLEENEE